MFIYWEPIATSELPFSLLMGAGRGRKFIQLAPSGERLKVSFANFEGFPIHEYFANFDRGGGGHIE